VLPAACSKEIVMPKNKDLKRLTRSRMHKTGESYTTARAQLLAKKKGRNTTATTAETELAVLAGMSDKAVKAATGCDWARWVWVLDAANAASMPHREIAKLIHDKWKISGWWAQTVAVGYERIRGLREIGQRRSGAYEANKSKTVPVPITKLYRAFSVTRTRNRWLPGVRVTVRKATPEKSMRITWEDDTSVEIYFTAKGDQKSQVAIQHRKLATKAEAAKMKAYWGERLRVLAEILVPSG
jgi:uncharacterized protein YndB with AHSA1/START domain